MHHVPDLFHAGGFIATADEIVQPFSLPRLQYRRPSDQAPFPPASDDDVEMVVDLEGVVGEEPLVMDMRDPAGDGLTRNIEAGRSYDGGGDKEQSESEITNEPMKTMAELAAEHAERQRQFELGSMKAPKRPSRGVRTSHRRKAADDESEDEPEPDEDEDPSEPSLSDYHSDSPAPSKQKATSSRVSRRKNPQSTVKTTTKRRNKRARSSGVDEGSDNEYGGSSRSMSVSAGSLPRRKGATRAMKATSRSIRTVSDPNSTSIAVPASDRVLRSRKARV